MAPQRSSASASVRSTSARTATGRTRKRWRSSTRASSPAASRPPRACPSAWRRTAGPAPRARRPARARGRGPAADRGVRQYARAPARLPRDARCVGQRRRDGRRRPLMPRDPITVELVKNALESIADEMAVTVQRTARSFVLKEAMDYSTALFDARGEMIAQGTCLPLHLGSMPAAVRAVLRTYGGAIAPGDLFGLNDPYDGGSHLPDVIMVKPVFVGDTLVGYSSVMAHQTDIGGRVAGGNASDSTEIYQEGLRIPPIRLYERGRPNDAVFRMIARNVRVPDTVLGDLHSEIAACTVGERQLLDLVAQYGHAELDAICRELLDYTEAFTRAEIRKLPDGEYGFTDYLDDDGIDPDPIRIQVTITVRGDEMDVDFTGTSSQVKGAINSVLTFTASTAWACIRSVLDRTIPNNAGFFRPIRVTAPERTIVNPSPPAAVAARGLTAFRIADTVFGALAKIAPDKVPASGVAADSGISLGGYHADGTPFVFL